MKALAWTLIVLPFAVGVYAYVVYPLILRTLLFTRPPRALPGEPTEWPFITITVPAYNEERVIRGTIENLLAADYPPDRREILVLSDCSTDRTEDIAREYDSQGVRVVKMPQRRGKTVAENVGGEVARGDIVVNLDASIRIFRDSLKALVGVFEDPRIAVSSGRDVSVGDTTREGNQGEQGYVGYEMWVRGLETKLGTIVGASGCFYGFRKSVYDTRYPDRLSRDFGVSLLARERGMRSVSVDEALCVVPRAPTLQAEFRRKIRTMSRGMETLWYQRHLMNPFRYGSFALMLLSHKVARWMVYPLLVLAGVGLLLLSFESLLALAILLVGLLVTGAGYLATRWPDDRRMPSWLALPGFLVASNLAGVLAWAALLKKDPPQWEPTRRPVA